MQVKIELKYKSQNYIIKASNELTVAEVINGSQLLTNATIDDCDIYLETKTRYIQQFNKLKDVDIVDNDIIKVLEKNEKTV